MIEDSLLIGITRNNVTPEPFYALKMHSIKTVTVL